MPASVIHVPFMLTAWIYRLHTMGVSVPNLAKDCETSELVIDVVIRRERRKHLSRKYNFDPDREPA